MFSSLLMTNLVGQKDNLGPLHCKRALVGVECLQASKHVKQFDVGTAFGDVTEPTGCKIKLGNEGRPEVVLITGGAGFLGQHIVKLLHERAENVREIRVFDARPWRNKLGHAQKIPMRTIVGDIRKLTEVRAAMKDVTTVIHTAGLVSFGTFPDFSCMEQVNVRGTANVIQSCVENNVRQLIYTSSVDVVVGFDDVIDGDESLAPPKKFLFPGYPETKHQAETLVSEANGRALAAGDGSVLHTLNLRPTVMYGEHDPWYVTSGLRSAEKNAGILQRVGNGAAKLQVAYVGNVAWAHLCAAKRLADDAGLTSGRSYFVTDDTPVVNTFAFMEPFLECRGYRLSNWSIPYPVAYSICWLTEWILWAVRPIYECNLEKKIHSDGSECCSRTHPGFKTTKRQMSLPSIIYVNHNLTFKRQRAEEALGYQPIYGHVTSLARSLKYYKDVRL